VVDDNFQRRLARVRESIGRAAERTGRRADRIEILPITKGHPGSLLRAVAAAGFTAIGENRVAEAATKLAELGRLGLRWHMVGHLQRNKVAGAIETFDVIESVDSLRLARRLSTVAARAEVSGLDVLVQVNTSGEAAKGGFSGDSAVDEIGRVCELAPLRVHGLMTMAPFTDDEAVLRRTFRETRRLQERCTKEIAAFTGTVLSMGMSNDFEIAVEEGATRLRLGTVLFGERA
jgi:pyridoxal phosphate enzyme (YggS family)